MTDLLYLTSFSNKTSSGEADLLTGRDLVTGLAFFTELTPGAVLLKVRGTVAGLADLVLGNQTRLLETADVRATGRVGLLPGELLTAGPLLGIFV